MAQSLPPVSVRKSTWVDIYAETGITVGTKIIIQNAGDNEAVLTERASQPTGEVGVNPISKKKFFTNSTANIGAWVFSTKGTTLQVEEA